MSYTYMCTYLYIHTCHVHYIHVIHVGSVLHVCTTVAIHYDITKFTNMKHIHTAGSRIKLESNQVYLLTKLK